MSNEQNSLKADEYYRDGSTLYILHEGSWKRKGEPILCNQFSFTIHPDYGNGLTKEDAEKEAAKIHSAIVNLPLLVETLRNLAEQYKLKVKVGFLEAGLNPDAAYLVLLNDETTAISKALSLLSSIDKELML